MSVYFCLVAAAGITAGVGLGTGKRWLMWVGILAFIGLAAHYTMETLVQVAP